MGSERNVREFLAIMLLSCCFACQTSAPASLLILAFGFFHRAGEADQKELYYSRRCEGAEGKERKAAWVFVLLRGSQLAAYAWLIPATLAVRSRLKSVRLVRFGNIDSAEVIATIPVGEACGVIERESHELLHGKVIRADCLSL